MLYTKELGRKILNLMPENVVLVGCDSSGRLYLGTHFPPSTSRYGISHGGVYIFDENIRYECEEKDVEKTTVRRKINKGE